MSAVDDDKGEQASDVLEWPADLGDALNSPLAQALGLSTRPQEILPMAAAIRAYGIAIPERVEAEAAYVLHFLVTMALRHGENWKAETAWELRAPLAALNEQRRRDHKRKLLDAGGRPMSAAGPRLIV